VALAVATLSFAKSHAPDMVVHWPDGRTTTGLEPPTKKSFKLDMVTIGRWENGLMKEEWLMSDNQAFMKQIGLAK